MLAAKSAPSRVRTKTRAEVGGWRIRRRPWRSGKGRQKAQMPARRMAARPRHASLTDLRPLAQSPGSVPRANHSMFTTPFPMQSPAAHLLLSRWSSSLERTFLEKQKTHASSRHQISFLSPEETSHGGGGGHKPYSRDQIIIGSKSKRNHLYHLRTIHTTERNPHDVSRPQERTLRPKQNRPGNPVARGHRANGRVVPEKARFTLASNPNGHEHYFRSSLRPSVAGVWCVVGNPYATPEGPRSPPLLPKRESNSQLFHHESREGKGGERDGRASTTKDDGIGPYGRLRGGGGRTGE
ncbi:hypothetical protein LZ31DRAFT_190465 [Colletotrichum somersetense]|nr:hypothetical protein LZ31DRAFT_190465 [Colletotrichum somersetense]